MGGTQGCEGQERKKKEWKDTAASIAREERNRMLREDCKRAINKKGIKKKEKKRKKGRRERK